MRLIYAEQEKDLPTALQLALGNIWKNYDIIDSILFKWKLEAQERRKILEMVGKKASYRKDPLAD